MGAGVLLPGASAVARAILLGSPRPSIGEYDSHLGAAGGFREVCAAGEGASGFAGILYCLQHLAGVLSDPGRGATIFGFGDQHRGLASRHWLEPALPRRGQRLVRRLDQLLPSRWKTAQWLSNFVHRYR